MKEETVSFQILRFPASLRDQLKIRAIQAGVSCREYVIRSLREAVQK